MKIVVARFAIPLIAALALGGCTRNTVLPASSVASDQPANFQLVTDIPIPANASMENDRSLILSDRDRWTGRVVMKVNRTTTELASFYQTQMPSFGWQPVMSVMAETSVLTYTRGDRAATVQIERSTLYGSQIFVTVAPRQADNGSTPSAGSDAYTSPRSAPAGAIHSEQLPPPSRR
jgi:hypothetical protein